jgi:hypothetical protein
MLLTTMKNQGMKETWKTTILERTPSAPFRLMMMVNSTKTLWFSSIFEAVVYLFYFYCYDSIRHTGQGPSYIHHSFVVFLLVLK